MRVEKAITWCLPVLLQLDDDNKIHAVGGFWGIFYFWIIQPIEVLFGFRPTFYGYEGPYLLALFDYFFGEFEEDE
jgi:hypothetical protein